MTRKRSTVRAAGCVVWRSGADQPEVILVHRPRWDDWSFPKGKVDRGETTFATAVREVVEETGLRVRLGPQLRDNRYTIATGQPKVVSYWAAQPPRGADISRYEANSEIDDVVWMSLARARRRLTYPRDVELLDEFQVTPYASSPLVIVRHTEARRRGSWRRSDIERPLSAEGRRAAVRLVPVLAAYGVTRIVTSDAARCVDTMLPFANAHRIALHREPGLSEEQMSDEALLGLAAKALKSRKRTAICTHRPVLPRLCAALGIAEEAVEPGGLVVVHRANGTVVSVEKAD